MDVLSFIDGYGIDTNSFIMAGSDISREGDLGEYRYRERITELCNHDTNIIPLEQLPIVYGYVIQEAIRMKLSGAELFTYALDRAKQFMQSNQYIFAIREVEVKHDVHTGKPKLKKGAKGQLAEDAYRANMGEGLTRKEMIAVLVDAADMSPAGASTYYAKYKKIFGV